ncbi:MAG: DNA-processing protein DprA [Patescibacteria group bacterium]
MSERDYWLGFSLCEGIGPKRFDQLLKAFGSAKDAWHASEADIVGVIGRVFAVKVAAFRSTFDGDTYLKKLEKAKAWFVILNEDSYPELLNRSHNPPFVLFGIGSKDLLRHSQTIGIVGTRKVTTYGRQVTEMITSTLVQADYCVVSGLAMGVDALAHATALNNGGKTIAVLGCGVDCCSPAENYQLYKEIITSGNTVVSEYPLSMPPTPGSFPSRNRIIAGLSQAVIVTEGAADSGALITARDSFTDNRPVFAVPGPITSSLSSGPNSLLQKGGKLVTSGEDILCELGVKGDKRDKGVKSGAIKGETREEQKVIDLLSNELMNFDEIAKRLKMKSSDIGVLLSIMEMKGFIVRSDRGDYQLKAS